MGEDCARAGGTRAGGTQASGPLTASSFCCRDPDRHVQVKQRGSVLNMLRRLDKIRFRAHKRDDFLDLAESPNASDTECGDDVPLKAPRAPARDSEELRDPVSMPCWAPGTGLCSLHSASTPGALGVGSPILRRPLSVHSGRTGPAWLARDKLSPLPLLALLTCPAYPSPHAPVGTSPGPG